MSTPVQSFEGFAELELTRGDLRVVWEWIGEGQDGDYDEEDPDDQPLLRFSAYVRVPDADAREELGYGFMDDEFVPADDASYCTQMPATEERELLEAALGMMLDRLESAFRRDDPPGFGLKRAAEDLSWLGPREVKRALAEAFRRAPAPPPVGEIGDRSRASGLAEEGHDL